MTDNVLSGKATIDTTDYKAGVVELNRQIRVIESGFRASAAAMGEWDKTSKGLELQTKTLTSKIDLQKQKVAALTGEYEKVAAAKGKDSIAAQELEIKLNKQKEALGKMNNELQKAQTALDAMGDESKQAGAKIQDLGEKEDHTAQKTGGLKKAMSGLFTALKASVIAAAAVSMAVIGIAAGIGNLVFKSAAAADALQEMSIKTGISVQRLQELSYIGKQTGTDLEVVTSANARLIRSMASAEEGSGKQAAAFRRLRIDVTDGNGALRDSRVVFQEALEKLAALPNATERDALAMELFGKSAQELNPLLKTSADEMARMTEEAHRVGAVVSDRAVAGLAALNDTLDGLKAGLKGVGGELAASLAPGIQGASDGLMSYLSRFSRIVTDSTTGKSNPFAYIATGFGNIFKDIIKDLAKNLPEAMNAGLTILEGIMGALIASLPVMLPAIVTMIQSLVGFIVQSLPIMVDAAVQILLMLVTSLISMLPMLLGAAIQIIIQIANGLSAALPTLIPAVEGIVAQLVMTLVQNLPMLITAALQLILALAQGLIAALPVMADETPKIIVALVDGLIENLPAILIAAIQLIMALAFGILESIPKLVAILPQVIDALVKEFKTPAFKEKMKSMGHEIVQGIGEGFSKAWATFKENFLKNWNELVDKVKGLLGIHSPSTVFAQIGVNMALGLGGGFTQQMNGVRQQIEDAVSGINGSGVFNPNLSMGNGSPTTDPRQVTGPDGKLYQLYFETYNEAGMNRFLRQTEMLYGS